MSLGSGVRMTAGCHLYDVAKSIEKATFDKDLRKHRRESWGRGGRTFHRRREQQPVEMG